MERFDDEDPKGSGSQGCDDGDSCTYDNCIPPDGDCVNLPKPIENDDDSCTCDSYDPYTDKITNKPIDCTDGDSCTDDMCNPPTGECYTDGSCEGAPYRILTVTQGGKKVYMSEEYFKNGTAANVGDTVEIDIDFLVRQGAADRSGKIEGTDPREKYVVEEAATARHHTVNGIRAGTSNDTCTCIVSEPVPFKHGEEE